MERSRLVDLVKGADLVLLGTALDSESSWQGGRILTRVRVQVEEVWAGIAPATGIVEVVTLGGVVGDLGQMVSGEASIARHDRVVLFLARQNGVFRVLGMAQGVFRVLAQAGEPEQVERALSGIAWVESSPAELFPDRLDALRGRVTELRDAR